MSKKTIEILQIDGVSIQRKPRQANGKKTVIFLADLVHTWNKVSVWTFPLNVGFIAEYIKQQIPNSVEVRLFKRPELMIEAIKLTKPDIVGLGYYVWNANLNDRIFELTKQYNPQTLTVGGGPNITSLNNDDQGARQFFTRQRHCDAYVYNQGERGFVELIHAYLDGGKSLQSLKKKTVAGCLINNLQGENNIQTGPELKPLVNLDEIPSPYLSGALDEFFNEPFVPLIETNRSCPYRCTFCAWGIGTSKLSKFSEQRVLEEINYFSKRCTKTSSLYICDANFGILERDVSFAEELYRCHIKYKYPGQIYIQWNKTRPDRVTKVAHALRGLGDIGASMQSLNIPTLEAIKRTNLPLEKVSAIVKELRGSKSVLFSELILGLPEETKESHIEANRKLIDLGAEIYNYNLFLLPGTEMDKSEYRAKYFKKTAWRLHDDCYGIYEGKKVFEGQEVIIQTSTMSQDDLRSFRFVHFLLQFMWSRRWYYDYLHLNHKVLGIHPVDFILKVSEACKLDSGAVGDVYRRFTQDHSLELFETEGDLFSYWSEDKSLDRLQSGEFGKLNGYYTYVILLDCHDEFNNFLHRISADLAAEVACGDTGSFLKQCQEVLRFSKALWINLTNEFALIENKEEMFSFDILQWRELDYKRELRDLEKGRGNFKYQFFLDEHQKEFLRRQIKQYQSHNVNATFRKMSADTSAHQFLYRVKSLESEESRV
jgi:radical SAM superfamily enzyme YgiQ (UPF0313 family)